MTGYGRARPHQRVSFRPEMERQYITLLVEILVPVTQPCGQGIGRRHQRDIPGFAHQNPGVRANIITLICMEPAVASPDGYPHSARDHNSANRRV